MIRWHLRITFVIFLLCAAGALLIQTQPYAYSKQQVFVPADCSAACFANIQPGVTSIDDAVAALESSSWVKQVDNRTINNVSGYISWTWSDQTPDWVNSALEGEIWATQKKVVQIMIYGNLQLGDIRLVLGLPDQEIIDRTADRKRTFSLYTAFYGQTGLMIQSWQPCNAAEPYRRPVILTYTLQSDPKNFLAQDSLSDLKRTCPFPRP
ncbi:MAG: hypothetical protein GC179_12555 [Anaerolineaceae bacterium]|nr:hypothetical protein [Anaerolineaceae bacterium]